MKSITFSTVLFLACLFTMSFNTPVEARHSTSLSLNIGALFPSCQETRVVESYQPVYVQPCPSPCYERVVVYPRPYQNTVVYSARPVYQPRTSFVWRSYHRR